mmetsp:Transcript_6864/g.11329  ORF Transcript_6864/g.11329 Transcript_6864/m.11329 type:complete len:231 (+) Transcript_6864:206-898(+)
MITVALVAMIAASYSMDTDASVSSGPNCEEFGTTPYEVLGITPSANRKKIKKAFRSHMRRLHPEKIGVDPKHVKCLYHAFETIMNPPETHEATTDPFKTSKGFNFKFSTDCTDFGNIPHEILGISSNATPKEVKKAYFKAMSKFHQKNRGDSSQAVCVQRAYDEILYPHLPKAEELFTISQVALVASIALFLGAVVGKSFAPLQDLTNLARKKKNRNSGKDSSSMWTKID